MTMIRIAYDPGPAYQQRVHQADFDLDRRGRHWSDADLILQAELAIGLDSHGILGIAVWEWTGLHWRTIKGQMP